MENITSILIDLVITLILGAAGLVVLIAVIWGIPYIVGKVAIHLYGGFNKKDPRGAGMAVIGATCLLWLIGIMVKTVIEKLLLDFSHR